MSKVVLFGSPASGKECYFYGMLYRMIHGGNGFTIEPQSPINGTLYNMIRLIEIQRPLEERFPEMNMRPKKYKLKLCYKDKKIEEIEWIEYPNEYVVSRNHEFLEDLQDADCLIISVGGENIKGSADDLDSIVKEFQFDYGGMDLNYALCVAAQKNDGGLPPVCIMVTKYDVVSPELRNKESIEYIVKNVFSILFHEDDEGMTRVATIIPVSLGKDIANGGRLDPIRMEYPICFAAYFIMAKAKKLENMKALQSIIEGITLYVNGEEKGWNEIFTNYEKVL